MLVIPEPMLATPVAALPGAGYAFEPKWDGYRALLARPAGGPVRLVSRRGTPMAAAFPEIAGAAERDLPRGTLLDGELVIWHQGRLAFELLQQRLGRTASSAARLAHQVPAHYVAFDLLHRGETDLMAWPYRERRDALEALFAEEQLGPPWTLCPMTTDPAQAAQWLRPEWAQAGIEGVVAKLPNRSYAPGRRGWLKYRSRDSTEAVIGAVTGSLRRPRTVLLGRLDDAGRLRYVGRSTELSAAAARDLAAQLAPAVAGHPWQGRTFSAGWGTRETLDVTLVAPDLVAEVSADTAVDAGRWRHPVRFQRLHPDLAAQDAPAFGAGNQPAAG